MTVTNRTVRTSHGDIAVSETGGSGLPVLLIHGNSSCKEVFAGQLDSELGQTYRLIAMDLPGHGASSDAIDPQRTYCMPGYADVAVELLNSLKVPQAAVFGWSLGGHIGIEMMPLFPGLAGLMITGAPPVRKDMDGIQLGFQPTPALLLAGKADFTEEDFAAFGSLTLGGIDDPVLTKALRRTHGLARELNFASLMAGKASDQRELAENSPVPLAIVNGEKDPIVNLDYIGGLRYRNLWDEHCFVLRGLHHVPFREAPQAFNAIFGRFLADMQKRVARTSETGTRRSRTHAA